MFRVKEDFTSLRRRAVVLCASAIALGCVSAAEAAWNPTNPNPNNFDTALIMREMSNPHSDLVTVAAHRGIHALEGTNQAPKVPENSLQAIGYAAQEGWESIEIDVKLTSDGVPVLSHDGTWGRETCYSSCLFAGPFDPSSPSAPGSCNNPTVDSLSLAQIQRSFFPGASNTAYLRDPVSLYCGGENSSQGQVHPPTLQEVYEYIRENDIQMVVTLDIQTAQRAAAAWQVVRNMSDRRGRPFSESTIFKVPAVLFKTTADYVNTFGGDYHLVNFNPVFHTSGIKPTDFGSEQAMIDWIRAFQSTPAIRIVALEVSLKESAGILTSVLTVARRHTVTGSPVNLSQFNPVGEHWINGDPKPRFFSSSDGRCCVTLDQYLFNNPISDEGRKYPNLPQDDADHRTSLDFLVGTGTQMITTDRPDVLQNYLLALNRRNICYMQTTGCPGGAGGSVGTRNHGRYAKPLRVLPLGDSITWGWSSSTGSGYRGPLRTALLDGGFSVDFVGSITSGTMADPYNEGHPGWRIDEIAGSTTQVVTKYQPNVVLLMAGTNDMVQGYELGTAPTRLSDLIQQILAAAPNTTVLVASLLPATDAAINNNVRAFNAQLPELIAQKRRQGLAVYLVDMSSFPLGDLADVVHPNDVGYQRMADLWLPAMRDVALAIEEAADCSSIPAGCNDPAIGSESHGPGPRLPANGWLPAGSIASGTDIPGLVQYVDMNGDGKADYVIMDPATGALTVYFNNGTDYPTYGGWTGPNYYASGAAPASQVHLADVNGDGRADYLVVDPTSGAVNAWVNQGGAQGGGWNYIGQVARGAAPGYLVRFADVTGDGRADYIVLDWETGAMQVWRNNGMDVPGGGGWIPMGQMARGAAPASMVRFADINNDRLADYLVLNPVTGALVAYLNNGMDIPGGGGWTPIGVIAPGTGAPGTQVQFADLNGDGATDYLVVGARGQTNGWLNNGGDLQSNLPPPHLFATPSVPKGPLPRNGWAPVGVIATGSDRLGYLDYVDMNADRKADFVITDVNSGALTVYINNGTDVPGGGGWGPPIAYASGAAPGANVGLADVSGDGRADYLIADPNSGSIIAWLNNGGDQGGGGWIYLGKVAAGAAPSGFVRFADVNGDGYADYLVVDRDTGAVTAWLNNGMDLPGGGGWTPLGTVARGAAPLDNVRFADINNDRRADYLVVNHQTGALQAWLNNGMDVPGGNGWTPLGEIASGVGAAGQYRVFADINGDGAADYLLVETTNRGLTHGWLNNGGAP